MSLKRWIISRTRSGEVCTSRAITSTVLPPAEARTTMARRYRTTLTWLLPPPRRTMRCSCRPSSSVRRRTFTRWLMLKRCTLQGRKWWTRWGEGCRPGH